MYKERKREEIASGGITISVTTRGDVSLEVRLIQIGTIPASRERKSGDDAGFGIRT